MLCMRATVAYVAYLVRSIAADHLLHICQSTWRMNTFLTLVVPVLRLCLHSRGLLGGETNLSSDQLFDQLYSIK